MPTAIPSGWRHLTVMLVLILAGTVMPAHAQAPKPLFTVEKVTGLDFSPDGLHIAVGLRDSIQIRNAKTGMLERTLDDGVSISTWGNGNLDWNPWRPVLAVRQKTTIDLWNTETGQLLKTLERQASTIAWSADGQSLYLGAENSVLVLDITMWDERLILWASGAITALAPSPDDVSLAVVTWDDPASPKVIDSRTGAVKFALKLPMEQNPTRMLSWSPDGKFILGDVDFGDVQGYTAIWSAETRKAVDTDRILTAAALSWSPDSKQFAAVTYLVDSETDQACAGIFDLRGKLTRDLCSIGERPRFIVWSGDSLAIADEQGGVYVASMKNDT